ncbi:MaoC/PaaZ C-terminal domain-containing protein [Bradyrhizobium elkanii]|uniref:MaoC/PaaZ C-terminal domain-containing protein n=1 Tax=Bradyrhizobium elkanii TaxID=29448 RepID=UPI001AE72216|nr:MaoC/PaaZ C-terminal domain-containing protein [Bradyrhizobium elkanii]MBP2434207.1 acyl dehydratase [Bradyrhizobium elkanii]WLA88882.1 MaoC/PaaZ C-terminal domain-containing protein [Bradyrhizobium elkanii]
MARSSQLVVVDDHTPSRALTVDDVVVGDAVEQRVSFNQEMRDAFRIVANDRAPVHDDERFSRDRGFGQPILQGLCVATRFSRLIGMYLPGEYAILEKVDLKFRRPSYLGQEIVFRVTVTRILRPMRVIKVELAAVTDLGEQLAGEAQCLMR